MTLSGKVYWTDCDECEDLCELLDKADLSDGPLEVVASDCAMNHTTNKLSFLVTWCVLAAMFLKCFNKAFVKILGYTMVKGVLCSLFESQFNICKLALGCL